MASSQPNETSASQPDDEAAATSQGSAGTSPARRRRRATAAARTPAPAPELPGPPASSAHADDSGDSGGTVPQEVESTAPRSAQEPAGSSARPVRRRRKATAAATTPQHAPAAEQPVLTAADADPDLAPEAEGAVPPADDKEPEEVDEAEDAEETEEADDAEEAVDEDNEPTRLPAASLLFQAPDPARARRRRRKATAATTSPQRVAPAEQAPPAETEEEDAAPGRGRRRRQASAPSTTPERIPPASGRSARGQEEDAEEQASTDDSTGSGDGLDPAEDGAGRRKRRRGGRGRRARGRTEESVQDLAEEAAAEDQHDGEDDTEAGEPEELTDPGDAEAQGSSRRRRRRRSRTRSDSGRDVRDEVTALKGSTRLEAKRQRRREGRAAGRRRPIVTEAEFLARRESVDRQMVVREQDGLNQIAVLEDGLLVEHYVARHTQSSMVGNVYIGRVQNVLPSMEAAFVDLGKGRNAVLYAGEVNWDAAGMEGRPRRIEDALSSGDTVLVQVTKDPIGHKGARLTSQVTLAGRYLVLVPGGTMTGISRKLPDTERARLKKILKRIVPEDAGVIVRTAAEGASEDQLADDVARLVSQWEAIDKKASQILRGSGKAPQLLKGEPELAVRVVRDVFNEDFRRLVVSGDQAWRTISQYVTELSPDLADRLEHWVGPEDVFAAHRVDEQLAKGFDRKVWLPSGGTLVIDRTEAMTVIDVNTGRFTGAGGTLEETVTRNNLEAAEEIVRQLRLRDIGGMVVIDFVDMVLESNRDLVLRRLVECLGRDRTRHQVTEVTSLGLVQMTRKRVGQGLVEAFSTPCECCSGRGFIVHDTPVENGGRGEVQGQRGNGRGRGRKATGKSKAKEAQASAEQAARTGGSEEAQEASGPDDAARAAVRGALAQIAAAAEHAHKDGDPA
ncbi:MAG: Rne/Rng family ribonuclease [Actinomyces sp.]|uniref:Rne/Rng family ribonuclease n=1 Tax=Actinomyces sp. TaxID=29317 RepID=UPI0026DBFF21|nr:Rne/Rng family ribonuclease [Actinomyces sp.]MDO4242653.1 Rne/Rng family ribonuclease [Actinomyces sp.]